MYLYIYTFTYVYVFIYVLCIHIYVFMYIHTYMWDIYISLTHRCLHFLFLSFRSHRQNFNSISTVFSLAYISASSLLKFLLIYFKWQESFSLNPFFKMTILCLKALVLPLSLKKASNANLEISTILISHISNTEEIFY